MATHRLPWLMPLLVLALSAPVHAHGMPAVLASPASAVQTDAQLDERVHRLAGELRCLVCQNQTVAESNVPLARQLKAEVRTQLAGGASEQQVRDFMAQRYGDFILYRPPVTQLTWLLWGGPLGLLLLGALLLSQQRTRPGQKAEDGLDDLDEHADRGDLKDSRLQG